MNCSEHIDKNSTLYLASKQAHFIVFACVLQVESDLLRQLVSLAGL